jgi:hypothetical protein
MTNPGAISTSSVRTTTPGGTLPHDDLSRRAIERRAIEALIWAMPAVNFELMCQATRQSKADFNQIVYWSRFLTWKNQTLTPNPTTIYLHPFYNTKDVGPMVLEIPPEGEGSITGSIDDAWQNALEDVGPAGADKGKGGKYLILPPGHNASVPAGHIALPSQTYAGYAILRSNVKGGTDEEVAKAVTYGKRVKFYPLSQAAKPPETVFVDAIDVVYDSTIPYDIRFFESLHRFVQREPWLERDRVMIDVLRSIGIEKDKPFAPDAGTRTFLESAAREAHAWLDGLYEGLFIPPFFDGTHWALPASPAVAAGMGTNFGNHDSYPVESRGVTYSMAYFSAKHLGEGQFPLDDDEGQGRTTAQRQRNVFAPGAGQRAGEALLVGHRLRPGQPCARSRDELVRTRLQYGGHQDQPGRVRGYLLRPDRPVRQGVELDPDQRERRVRGPDAILWAREAVLRQDLDAARYRESVRIMTQAQAPAPQPVGVTVENFVRAETDLYFSAVALKEGGFGRFEHKRELSPIDHQTVIRQNRDTLYSAAVFDLDAGPVTITLPETNGRFQSLQLITEDEYTPPTIYGAGPHAITKERIGTRYVLAAVRTFVDPSSASDLAEAHRLQDALNGSWKFPEAEPIR